MTEEVLALYDESGRPTGHGAARSVVRRDNLRHATVAVLVRDPAGRLFVHRRTDDKDVYPGMHDAFVAGGVQLGETPEAAARRELAEELGIVGVEPYALAVLRYADAVTDQVAFVSEVTYGGPVTLQASEIAWGGWMEVAELRRRLAAGDAVWPFVPDGRLLLEQVLPPGAG